MIKKNSLIILLIFSFSFSSYCEEDVLSYISDMNLNLDSYQPEKVEEIFDQHENVLIKNPLALE